MTYSKPSRSITPSANTGSFMRCATLTGTRSPTARRMAAASSTKPPLGASGPWKIIDIDS